ncbi:MAG: tetratricopeptide repeat protein, partial [Candidatus Omnitrophota bacterium]
AQFKKVIEEYPGSDSVENSASALGDILTEKGEYKQAVKILEDILQKSDDDDFKKTIYKKIADIYQELGHYDKALGYFGRALGNTNNDFNAQVQFQIAECYESRGKYNNSIAEYLKVGYLFPKSKYWSTRAHLRCAQIFEAQDRWLDAKKIYEKLTSEDIEEAKYARERLKWIEKHKEELGL